MGFEPYLATSVLSFLFRQGTLPGGEAIYAPDWPMSLALYDEQGYELYGQPGYNRAVVSSADWSFAVGGTISNIVAISFDEATGDWTEAINSWALIESATDYGLVTGFFNERPLAIGRGDTPVIVDGELEITLDGESMAGGFSDYMENSLMNHFFGKETYMPPINIWVGLLTNHPGDDPINTDCNEVLWGASYLRIATWPYTWQVGGSQDCWNVVDITFPLAEELWGTVDHYALFDVATPEDVGNVLIVGPVWPEKVVSIGSTPRFEAADLGPPKRVGIDLAIFDLE